jgi:transcriptional regulator with XRE-family HTH domain
MIISKWVIKMYKRIKELRQEANRSQINVATILGIDQSNYSKYERGALEPQLDFIIKIADFYNVSVDYIIERTNNKEIKK